jgi:hypothetical protein
VGEGRGTGPRPHDGTGVDLTVSHDLLCPSSDQPRDEQVYSDRSHVQFFFGCGLHRCCG